MLKIGIIGTGWYGCHLALELKKVGHHVELFEKGNKVFSGASGANTNRLHSGFHYPRSKNTRLENLLCLELFVKKYSHFTFSKKNNVYGISSIGSILDWETYKDILMASNLDFIEVSPTDYGFQNLQGALLCNEYFIDFAGAKNFFQKNLEHVHLNYKVINLEESDKKIIINKQQPFDFIIDCSYSSYSQSQKTDIRYEVIQLPIVKGINNDRELSFVIMDGKFQSLTPYAPLENHYTLYDVEYSSILQADTFEEIENAMKNIPKYQGIIHQKEILDKANHFYTDFSKKYEITGNIITMRATLKNNDANRGLVINESGRMLSLFSGKISSIFQAQEYVENYLKNFPHS